MNRLISALVALLVFFAYSEFVPASAQAGSSEQFGSWQHEWTTGKGWQREADPNRAHNNDDGSKAKYASLRTTLAIKKTPDHTSMHPASSFPRTLRIGIFVFDNFEPIDVWGFIQAFSIARFIGTSYDDPPPYPFEIVFITNETNPGIPGAVPKPVKSYNGPRVAPDFFRDDALGEPIDLLMIPGGSGTGDLLVRSDPAKVEELVSWVRAMDARVSLMTSVCTGAAILARAGVLDGQPAATNHQAFAWVSSFGPRVRWDKVSRWVDAGRYVTSAGTSAGTDMALHLVERLEGRAVAEAAARAAEYDWHRDPQQPIVYPQQADVPTARR